MSFLRLWWYSGNSPQVLLSESRPSPCVKPRPCFAEDEMTTTVFIVENQPAVGIGLELLLGAETRFRVVGVALNCDTALPVIMTLRPEVVIVDIDCPRLSKCRTNPALFEISGYAALIVITLLDDSRTSRIAQCAHASAVVLKSSPTNALLDAIALISHPGQRVGAAMRGNRDG